MTPADERILRQYGKKLSQPDIFLQASKDERFQITSERKPAAKKSAIMIDAKYVRCWQRADLLEDHGSGKLVLSDQGRSWLRRQQAAHMPYMAQHQARCEQQLPEVGAVERNVSISPLVWLRSREKTKRFGIDELEFEAGERFARDFHLGQDDEKLTMNWQRPIGVAPVAKDYGANEPAHVLDARRRLNDALDYLGPGLDEMMLAICCYEQGLEACENVFSLLRRSAKMVLKLGLLRLSVFYGFQSAKAAAASFRIR